MSSQCRMFVNKLIIECFFRTVQQNLFADNKLITVKTICYQLKTYNTACK